LKGDVKMSDAGKTPLYKIGDQVRLTFGGRLVGRVMEVQTVPPGGYGNILYHLYIPMDPEPLTPVVRESEIEKA
jgi:hypothetical protein